VVLQLILTIISVGELDGRPKRTSRKSKKIPRVSKDGARRTGSNFVAEKTELIHLSRRKKRSTKKVRSLWIVGNKIGDAFNNTSVMLEGKPHGNQART
jgi:hypothetical protein